MRDRRPASKVSGFVGVGEATGRLDAVGGVDRPAERYGEAAERIRRAVAVRYGRADDPSRAGAAASASEGSARPALAASFRHGSAHPAAGAVGSVYTQTCSKPLSNQGLKDRTTGDGGLKGQHRDHRCGPTSRSKIQTSEGPGPQSQAKVRLARVKCCAKRKRARLTKPQDHANLWPMHALATHQRFRDHAGQLAARL